MANLYGKLRALSKINENKPKIGLTKQEWSDTPFVIRGKDEGVPAWHFILVPHNKIVSLKNQQIGGTFDCIQFGCIIKYRDDQGKTNTMSGWGTNPPQSILTWFEEHYDYGSIDENIQLDYEKDDIRLCAIQRSKSDQLIGICQRYHKRDHFHFIELLNNNQTSLAYRSGLRNFDRFICLNGINIEHETVDQITKRFQNESHLPIQMLVCSPSTYQYYKSNNITLHADLPTVQHLKPVFDTSEVVISLFNQTFCVVILENSHVIHVILHSAIFKSPDITNVNDICFIEIEGKYRRGKIKFKGSQEQCEKFRVDLMMQLNNGTIDKYTSECESHDDKSILNVTIPSSEKNRFENLPNELMFDIFNYLRIKELHQAFIDLNSRFNNLLFSRYNMLLIYDENTDPLLIKLYGYKIVRLIIDTSNQCDLSQFCQLHSLILCNRNSHHLIQIRPETLPNLVNLSFLLKYDFRPPIELVNDIFSNRYPFLRNVNLGYLGNFYSKSWLISPSLRILSIRCHQLTIIRDILISCPNLYHLQLHILYNYDASLVSSSSSFIHPLKRFTLWSEELELAYDIIDDLLSYMPDLIYLYLQTEYRSSFTELTTNIINRLHYLSRFDCFVKELIMRNERIDNLNNIRKISSCFNRIQCIKESEDFRIFATE